MKTLLTPVDRAAKALKALARRPRPHRRKPVSLGGAVPEIDSSKALRLGAALEDEEIARKLEPRRGRTAS